MTPFQKIVVGLTKLGMTDAQFVSALATLKPAPEAVVYTPPAAAAKPAPTKRSKPAPAPKKYTPKPNKERIEAAFNFLQSHAEEGFSSTQVAAALGWPKPAARPVLAALVRSRKIVKAGDSNPTTRYGFDKEATKRVADAARLSLNVNIGHGRKAATTETAE